MARCDLCPHHCVLKEGQTGFCHQRMNKEGSIVLKDYGAITSWYYVKKKYQSN